VKSTVIYVLNSRDSTQQHMTCLIAKLYKTMTLIQHTDSTYHWNKMILI